MNWTNKQKDKILNDYWYGIGKPKCPVCNTPLSVFESGSDQKYAIDLTIECPRCDEGFTVEGQDATEDPK